LFVVIFLLAAFCSAQMPWESYDICAGGGDTCSCSGHGLCQNDKCACIDSYSGRDCSIPPNNAFSQYRVKPGTPASTYYCDLATGCSGGSCGYGNLNGRLPPGIEGIAAVNPSLYGSRVRPGEGAAGQGCGQCYTLTKGSVSKNIVITDRCAGYCHGTSPFLCNAGGSVSTQCVFCLAPYGGPNGVLSPPACSCFNSTYLWGKDGAGGYCSTTNLGSYLCDWCDANDHPHFDLNREIFEALCPDGLNLGHCLLDSYKPISCGKIN